MRISRIAIIATLVAALGACNSKDDTGVISDPVRPTNQGSGNGSDFQQPVTPPNPTVSAAGLEGEWTINGSQTQQRDGLAITVTDMRQAYSSDGKTTFSARVTVSGTRLTANYRMTGSGTWAREGNVLREGIDDVTFQAETDDPRARLAGLALAQAYKLAPDTTSDIIELTPNMLRVRERSGGTEITATR